VLEPASVVAELGARDGHELGLGCAAGDELRVAMEPFAQLGQVPRDIVEEAEEKAPLPVIS